MSTLMIVGIALIALFIIGKLMMSVGKMALWGILVVGIVILAAAGAKEMGWVNF